jgi:hypothetical protein
VLSTLRKNVVGAEQTNLYLSRKVGIGFVEKDAFSLNLKE